jgi:DNA-binding transcriptional LysR family regulator
VNLQHLRAFASVAAEGNITRAARRLRISQPAVSKQLAELEAELGTTLFDRLPRGVRLTEAGELLLVHAQRIFAAESAAEAEISELTGLMRGRLSIGASTTIGSYLIPGVFGVFNRSHPHIKLALEIANTTQVQSLVLDDRIDLGLTEGFVASEQLDVEVVHHDEMVAIVSPQHPLRRRASVELRDLARMPFICREQGSGTRDVIEAALSEQGLLLEPVMALGSTEAVKSAVSTGLGVAIVSRLTVELELSVGRLAQLDVRDLNIRRALHLVRLRGKRESPAVEAFITLLRKTLGDSS